MNTTPFPWQNEAIRRAEERLRRRHRINEVLCLSVSALIGAAIAYLFLRYLIP